MVAYRRPSLLPGASSFAAAHRGSAVAGFAALWLVLASHGWCAPPGSPDLDLRLRVVWGGGEARQWHGLFTVDNGTLDQLRPLGLEADEPGSLVISANTVPIRSRSARSYDGFDVSVCAPPGAIVRVQLGDVSDELDQSPTPVRLSQLVRGSVSVPLDHHGNRLSIQRAPGDRLRVRTDRPSVVFSPSEPWTIDVAPVHVGVPASSSVRLEVQMTATRGTRVLWQTRRDLHADAEGALPEQRGLEIPLPDREGVYDISLRLTRTGLRKAVILGKPAIERKLQVVVIGERTGDEPKEAQPWSQVLEFDPAQPRWWERVPRVPQWKLLPGVKPGRLGNRKSRTVAGADRTWTELEAGGWQAYHLAVAETGTPHILEIEYPVDHSQTLGISILEPNAAGTVAPVGLDSGVDVSAESARAASDGQAAWHRLVFWPRTKTPYVLLTNRHSGATARYGRVRVMAGPQQLASKTTVSWAPGTRLPLAYFARPLFPEIFCARDALDADSHRGLDDWQTFYEGGTRLAQYLKYAGYVGACISVYCEGSAIYPSGLLDATSKYDTGVYFGSGQDPLRKDVLEMLLRVFDREGLQLVPALQFTSPLPALESILDREQPEPVGVALVDGQGRRWIDQHGTQRGSAPYYNPLDERVQQAMRDVVRELTERYGHHRSLAGVCIDLSPRGFALLPGAQWGHDQRTIQRFRRATSSPGDAEDVPAQIRQQEPIRTAERAAWWDWRAAQIFQLYGRLHAELAAVKPGARLFLAGSDLIDADPVQQAMRPALPRRVPLADAMKQMGIDPRLYRDQAGIVLLRPQRLAPMDNVVEQAVRLQFNQSQQVDKLLGSGRWRGSLFYHETRALRLAAFDKVSPFGKDKTRTWLAPRFAVAGPENRHRFARSLAALDANVMLDGGWTVTMGQEESLRRFLEAYRQLPADAFHAPAREQAVEQPVTVRTLVRDHQTYIYLVNDSPWHVSTHVELTAPASCRAEAVDSRDSVPPLIHDRGAARWTVQLEPFELLVATLTAPDVTVTHSSVQLPPSVVSDLQTQITRADARLARLKRPPPLPVLENPGFETPSASPRIPGWVADQGPNVQVQVEPTDTPEGKQALRLHSSGPVARVRSETFAVPETGRLSLTASLRCEPSETPPKLRLVIEGQVTGGAYHRWPATVGVDAESGLRTQWWPFVLPITDLPVSRLENLRVGFDLLGPGTVWIDDVRLSQLSFTPPEQRELGKMVARAHYQWRQQKYADCARGMDQYWPRFLRQYVPLPRQRLATVPDDPVPSTSSSPVQERPKRSVLDRVRRWVPHVPRF